MAIINYLEVKLSIIVPFYNAEKYIGSTINSIIGASIFCNCELFLIDDGSTDNCRSIIEEEYSGFDNIRYYCIEHSGVSAARNYGMKLATGEYITFLDGDDQVEPLFFEKAITELINGNYDFVQGNFYEVYNSGRKPSIQNVDHELVINQIDDALPLFFGKNKHITNNVWGKVFKRSILQDIEFDESLKVSEDKKFIFDVLERVSSIKLMPDYSVYYFQHDDSLSHSVDISKFNNQLEVLSYCKERIDNVIIQEYVSAERLNILISIYQNILLGIILGDIKKYREDIIREKANRNLSSKLRTVYFMIKYFPNIYRICFITKNRRIRV